jgi:SAM-dependent methyltransferase
LEFTMNERMIKDRIKEFTWYTPVDFGNGLITKGNFKGQTSLDSIHFGLGKWKYIIERNLPDLQGKRVMDIGCNAGLFCIQMARMGAVEVVGIDSDETWPKWREQALFVKEALEWRCRTDYPIKYIDSSIEKIPEMQLGKFDVVTALCCLYYLKEDKLRFLLKFFRSQVDYLLIQCNTRRRQQPPEVHRRAVPSYMGRALKEAGYPYIAFDRPWLYERPVVVGSNYPIIKAVRMLKIDRIRHWIRKRV